MEKHSKSPYWCVNDLPTDFLKDSSTTLREYGQISSWAISKSNHYLPNAINEFLDADEADAFLVAYVLLISKIRC